MKRVALIGVFCFLIILHFELAAALGCANDNNQIIFKIYSQSNAHAEVWNGAGNYPVRICFDDRFNGAYNGANPHDAGGVSWGGNKVLGLSDDTNAHVQGPTVGTYPVSVNFGDLYCEVKNLIDSCANLAHPDPNSGNPGALIAYIASDTNAHVSLSPDAGYKKLCCASQAYEPVGNACGNGIIDDGEVCDGLNVNGLTCADIDPDYIGGTLQCNGDCDGYNVAFCEEEGQANQCADSISQYTSPPPSSVPMVPNTCGAISNWPVIGFPTQYYGNELEMRQYVCQSCSALIGGFDYPDAPANALNEHCEWIDDLCQTVYNLPGGVSCIIRELDPGTCDQNTNQRTITYTDTCDLNCDVAPETCSRPVPCGQVIQLPFFGKWQMFASIVLIVIIYLAINIRRK